MNSFHFEKASSEAVNDGFTYDNPRPLVDPYTGAVIETIEDMNSYADRRYRANRNRLVRLVLAAIAVIAVLSFVVYQQVQIKNANQKIKELTSDIEQALSLADSYQSAYRSLQSPHNDGLITIPSSGSDVKVTFDPYRSDFDSLMDKYGG